MNSPPTTHRISEFHKWNKEKSLEIAPPFQRKPVWSDKNRSYLIDTILHQLPVPEIYIQVKTDKSGNTKYIVVDGQQRMRAILDFIEGEFELLESESNDFGGKDFQSLSDGIKKDFWDYPLVTRELKTDNDDEIRHIFKRLNKYVVPLNAQELRNATFRGEFINLMNNLAEDDFWIDNKIASPNDVRRMRDIEFISELFVAMMEGVQDGRKNLDNFYKLYDAEFKDAKEWEKQFFKTISLITDIFNILKGTKWNSKADFYSIFLAFSELLKNHYFPQESYDKIKNSLSSFRSKVNVERDESKNKKIVEYYLTTREGIAKKEQRLKRTNIVKSLVLPFLIPKDDKKNYTEEQRQLAWDLSRDKKCAVCKEKVEWKDYHLDHKISYSKGGMTTIENSQITHKSCNLSKSNK